jgi:mersacidin/lichenicidin family type 2 lantibiotic
MANVDIARALKDKTYFNSLSEEQKAVVRAANPAGEPSLDDSDLDTVSGGLGGGEELMATTTTSASSCSCSGTTAPAGEIGLNATSGGSCACNC